MEMLVCLNFPWKEVVVLGGNDCRETEVMFDKASFEDEFKEILTILGICIFDLKLFLKV